MCIVNQIGQMKAIAQLWREFVLELRHRYDNSVYIPYLTTTTTNSQSQSGNYARIEKESVIVNNGSSSMTPPDLSRCLLHQKLQMLNCCVKKRLDRKRLEELESSKKVNFDKHECNDYNDDGNEDDDEDEEFYDCEDDDEASLKPEGRLKKLDDLTLLNRPAEPIYMPITQVYYLKN
jgi:Rab3 GTPase-activating protein catalytic subunit